MLRSLIALLMTPYLKRFGLTGDHRALFLISFVTLPRIPVVFVVLMQPEKATSPARLLRHEMSSRPKAHKYDEMYP